MLMDTTQNTSSTDSNANNSNVFEQVFSNLGDHSGFYIANYHVCDLPIVLLDRGIHIYCNKEAMLADNMYTEVNHEIVRTSDGVAPTLDLSITNLVVFQWIAVLFILFVFYKITRRNKLSPSKPPKGFLANATEKIIIYIRDEVVSPNFADKNIANSLSFYFVATFIFILVVNLVGLVPGSHTATGAIPVTAALAIVAFFVINGAAIKYSGIKSWFKHLLGGAPLALAPLMIPIEILGLVIKPFSLTIRLFANMTAGHIILFTLLALLFLFHNIVLSAVIVPFSVFLYILELLVAFIQAFVFTMLVAIYTGQSVGEHSRHGQH